MSTEIEIQQSIYERNEQMAQALNRELTQNGIFTVNVMGAPGVGKTSSLIQLIQRLSCPARVIEGDIQSDLDCQKLSALGINATQINTGGACHLDTPLIAQAVRTMPQEPGILFIENIGNLVCPAEFLIGEHIKLLLVSVTEGSDKPYKYPLAFEKASIILLSKIDLLPYVDFDETQFMHGVRLLNRSAPVIRVSAKTGAGFDEVSLWITQAAKHAIVTL